MLNRRELLKSSLMGAGAVASNVTQAETPVPASSARPEPWGPAPNERNGNPMPNILWICADMQRYDTIEGLNNDHARTPNIRKLMNDSVTLTHAYVQSPVCSPSRASFLTGRYPHTTGLRALGQRIRPDEKLITKILSDNGYACGLVGKMHLSPAFGGRIEDRIDDGYDVFTWSHDLTDQWPGHNMWREWLRHEGVQWPTAPAGTLSFGMPIDPKYTQTAWCSNEAIRFIRGQQNFRPWLMSVNIFQPHAPYHPTKEYLSRYRPSEIPSPIYRDGELENKPVYQQLRHKGRKGEEGGAWVNRTDMELRTMKAAYYAMVEQVDTEVGRMLQALEDTGQADNTIVIYMSDHGEMLGDHGLLDKGPFFYEGAIRVPLIIRWPGRYKAGLRSDVLIEMTDLAPTLMEAAGFAIPEQMQGRSMTGLLTGATDKHRDSIYCEFFDAYHLYNPPPMAACVRTEEHKLVYYQTLNTGELYDMSKDPDEKYNLWETSSARAVQQELMQRLLGRMIATVDPRPLRKCLW